MGCETIAMDGDGWLGRGEIVTLEGRCSGHCCREFTLSKPSEELARLAARGVSDAQFVERHMEVVGESMFDPYDGRPLGSTKPIWRCRALTAEGDCARYDERPGFCRRYGYDNACYHPSCTLIRRVEPYVNVGPPNIHEFLIGPDEEQPVMESDFDGWHIVVHTEPLGRTDPKSRVVMPKSGKAFVQTYQPKKGVTKSFEGLVAMAVAEVMGDVPVLDQPLMLDVLAVFDRPKRLEDPHQPDGLIVQAQKPDRDNIEKAIQDAMKTVWRDDCRVSVGTTVKAYRERDGKPRVEIWLRPISDDEVIVLHGHRVAMAVSAADKAARKRAEREAKARAVADAKAAAKALRATKKKGTAAPLLPLHDPVAAVADQIF